MKIIRVEFWHKEGDAYGKKHIDHCILSDREESEPPHSGSRLQRPDLSDDLYLVLTKDMFLYGELPVAIPEPRFVVFYNGEQKMEERAILRLSDLYRPKTEHPYLELETLVLNINKGYNAELMEKCRELHDYSAFIALVREEQKMA